MVCQHSVGMGILRLALRLPRHSAPVMCLKVFHLIGLTQFFPLFLVRPIESACYNG